MKYDAGTTNSFTLPPRIYKISVNLMIKSLFPNKAKVETQLMFLDYDQT